MSPRGADLEALLSRLLENGGCLFGSASPDWICRLFPPSCSQAATVPGHSKTRPKLTVNFAGELQRHLLTDIGFAYWSSQIQIRPPADQPRLTCPTPWPAFRSRIGLGQKEVNLSASPKSNQLIPRQRASKPWFSVSEQANFVGPGIFSILQSMLACLGTLASALTPTIWDAQCRLVFPGRRTGKGQHWLALSR